MPKGDRSTLEATLVVSARQHALSLVGLVLGGSGDPCGICKVARAFDLVVKASVRSIAILWADVKER